MTQSGTVIATPADLVTAAIQRVTDLVAAKIGASQAKALAPVITQYGPTFAAMTAEQVWNWLMLAAKGDPFAAHQAIVKQMTGDALVDWTDVHAKWQLANKENAAAIAFQRDAMAAVVRGLVTIAASLVAL